MPTWLSWLILILAILLPVGFIIYAGRDITKELPVFKLAKAWKKLECFERHLFKVGLVLFIPIPVLKNHILADTYPLEFLVELLPAVASAMLVTGILALVRELHTESSH